MWMEWLIVLFESCPTKAPHGVVVEGIGSGPTLVSKRAAGKAICSVPFFGQYRGESDWNSPKALAQAAISMASCDQPHAA